MTSGFLLPSPPSRHPTTGLDCQVIHPFLLSSFVMEVLIVPYNVMYSDSPDTCNLGTEERGRGLNVVGRLL